MLYQIRIIYHTNGSSSKILLPGTPLTTIFLPQLVTNAYSPFPKNNYESTSSP
ncbi:MAG: hypothetical protein F6K31_25095 [Symploca sp. SIO2G7]|nr:hypothetical protein [Symploca sp. SIO2G7]